MKSLGIFIATPGRASLFATLQSILYQQAPVEDILVVGDGFHKPTAELVEEMATLMPVRYVATTKTRDWGHSQQNYALEHVRGDYLIYQDDDDIFLPRALTEAARLVNEFRDPKPLIGRVKTPRHGLLWQMPIAERAVLDGHCLVVPNDKKKLGYFTTAYSGDQAYIRHCLSAYDEWAWTDRVWTLTRPQWTLWPAYHLEQDGVGKILLVHDDGGVPGELAARILWREYPGEDRLVVDLTDVSLTDLEACDLAEFVAWMGQSKDIWTTVRTDSLLAGGLRQAGYKEHCQREEHTEFVREWADLTRVEHFDVLVDQDGPIRDWRDDIWGRGRTGA